MADKPTTSTGTALPTLDRPAEANARWAGEDVAYLYDPESRELQAVHLAVWWDDGAIRQTYEAQIKRDGRSSWAWWEGDRFIGTHQPDLHQLLSRAISRGRGKVLSGMT